LHRTPQEKWLPARNPLQVLAGASEKIKLKTLVKKSPQVQPLTSLLLVYLQKHDVLYFSMQEEEVAEHFVTVYTSLIPKGEGLTVI